MNSSPSAKQWDINLRKNSQKYYFQESQVSDQFLAQIAGRVDRHSGQHFGDGGHNVGQITVVGAENRRMVAVIYHYQSLLSTAGMRYRSSKQ